MGSATENLGMSTLSTGIGGVIGLGTGAIENAMNFENSEALQALNIKGQKELADYYLQKDMEKWERQGYKATADQMRRAGLNVGLMYGKGGVNGSTASSGNVSTPVYQNNRGIEGMKIGLDMALQQAQVKNLNADSKKKEAEAENVGANTKTENATRDLLVENMKQSGINQWFENIKERMLREGYDESDEVTVFRNVIYGSTAGNYNENSPAVKQFNNDLLKTVAEAKNLDSSTLLNDEKAKAIWKELLIATRNADANMINAKASQLAKLWETGEFTNWKTWTDLAVDATGAVSDLIKTGKTPVKINSRK